MWLEYNYGSRRGFWPLTPFGLKWNSPFLSSWIGPAARLAKIPWSNLALGFTNEAARGRQEIGWCFAWDLFGHVDFDSSVIATKKKPDVKPASILGSHGIFPNHFWRDMWKECRLLHVAFISERTGIEWAFPQLFVRKLWRALDEDGGGSIQRDEWESSLDKVGYFGPSGPIFSYWAEILFGIWTWHDMLLYVGLCYFEVMSGIYGYGKCWRNIVWHTDIHPIL